MASPDRPVAPRSSIVSATGKTRLRSSLERARDGRGPCIALWIWFPGYSLARLIGGLGADVRLPIDAVMSFGTSKKTFFGLTELCMGL